MQIDSRVCNGVPYGAAWPGGAWITTADLPGNLDEAPDKKGNQLLHFDVSFDGRIAGQGTSGACRYWNGATWLNLGPTYGVRTCAFSEDGTFFVAQKDAILHFDRNGAVLEILPGPGGGQGIRFVRLGQPVLGDATLNDGYVDEWTEAGQFHIGQGHDGGLWAVTGGTLRLLYPGLAFFPFVHLVGSSLAITFGNGAGLNVRILTTLDEIAGLPVYTSPAPAPTPDPVPLPTPTPEPTPVTYSPTLTSTWTHDQLVTWVHQMIVKYNSADNETYWVDTIATHPADSSQTNDTDYWEAFIARGDGAGKGPYHTNTPLPMTPPAIPLPTGVTMEDVMKAISNALNPVQERLNVLEAKPDPDLSGFITHGAPVTVNGRIPGMTFRALDVVWEGKIS